MKLGILSLKPSLFALPLIALLISPDTTSAQIPGLPTTQTVNTAPGVAGYSIINNSPGAYALQGTNPNFVGVYGLGYYGLFGNASVSAFPGSVGVYGYGGLGGGSYGIFANAGSGSNSYAVYGTAQLSGGADAYSAYFVGGSGGAGYCRFNGGPNWTCTSDRNLKENVTAIDVKEILQRVSELPITRWNMKGEKTNVKHIGPMAQDFHAAFAIGDNDKLINTADIQGVALAAIQGLHKVVQEKDIKIQKQEAEIAQLRKQMNEMEARFTAKLTSLEQTVHANNVLHQHRLVVTQSKP